MGGIRLDGLRRELFDIIEPGEKKASRIYDSVMITVICLSLLPLFFRGYIPALWILDRGAAIIFIVDYIFRLITCDIKLHKSFPTALLIYPFTPMAIVDLLSILPSFLMSVNHIFRILKLFRLVRSICLFRLIKLGRYAGSLRLLSAVLRRQSVPLISVFALTCGYILICALVMFNLEPDTFPTYFDAVYWASISITTIGYGDLCPVTRVGKVVAIFSSIVGIAVIALPAGVITAGYLAELKRLQNKK